MATYTFPFLGVVIFFYMLLQQVSIEKDILPSLPVGLDMCSIVETLGLISAFDDPVVTTVFCCSFYITQPYRQPDVDINLRKTSVGFFFFFCILIHIRRLEGILFLLFHNLFN